jgi:integration host factor subunit beta
MTKSELIALISNKQPHLLSKDVELAINTIVQTMTDTVAIGERIEIRGFGSFNTVEHAARIGRNPKTGEAVTVPNRHAVHFKPGLELRYNVNVSRTKFKISDL